MQLPDVQAMVAMALVGSSLKKFVCVCVCVCV